LGKYELYEFIRITQPAPIFRGIGKKERGKCSVVSRSGQKGADRDSKYLVKPGILVPW